MMVNDVNESIKIRINLEKQALDIQKLRETLARLIHEIQDSGMWKKEELETIEYYAMVFNQKLRDSEDALFNLVNEVRECERKHEAIEKKFIDEKRHSFELI